MTFRQDSSTPHGPETFGEFFGGNPTLSGAPTPSVDPVEKQQRNFSPSDQLGASTAHPRTVGWFGTTAVAMGGINQSLFLLGALFVGQGTIRGQGSAAIPLLIVGLLLSWA